MIPILYSGTETAFTSSGLGRLADAISCTVDEQLNGEYELALTYPVDGIHYADIVLGAYVYAVPHTGANPQPFSIYSISKPIDGKVTIQAEHVSYRLSYIPVMPFTAASASAAMTSLSTYAAESCPFTFTADVTKAGTIKTEKPLSARSIISGSDENSIISTYGGELEYDKFQVKLLQHRGSVTSRVVRYGKDLVDLTQEASIADTITGVCPYYVKDSVLVTLPEQVLHSAAAANYPYQRTVPLDCSSAFENKPTQAQLRAYAQQYMTDHNIGIPKVSITISMVDLAATEEYAGIAPGEVVSIGDTIGVSFERLGVQASAEIVSYQYDVLSDRYLSIVIGSPKESLAETLIVQQESDASAIISAAVVAANQFNKSSSKTVALSNATEATLVTMTELDALFGLTSGTCNNTNTVITAANADTTITTPVTGVGYSSGAWIVKFDQLVTGSVLVAFTAQYYGG